MSLGDLACRAKSVKDLANCRRTCPLPDLAPSFGHEQHMVFAALVRNLAEGAI